MTTAGAALVPHQLTIMTTNGCTARCAHCSVSAGPERNDALDSAAIIAAVEAAHALSPISLVVFAGGEPTMLGDDLLDSIAQLDMMGVATRLVTNASWADTPAHARERLVSLREAGLREVNISADDYHLPFIPLANVANAWHSSKGLGFQAVVIALSHGPSSRVTPSAIADLIGESPPLTYDDDGSRLALGGAAEDGTVYAVANHRIYRIGRGRKLRDRVSQFPGSPQELDVPCPWAVRSAALSPKGHLVACCGIEAEDNEVLDFGSTYSASMEELVDRANKDLLVRSIALLGPQRVLQIAHDLDPDVSMRPRYAAICELCEDVVGNPRAVSVLRRNPGRLEAEMAAARLRTMLRAAADGLAEVGDA